MPPTGYSKLDDDGREQQRLVHPVLGCLNPAQLIFLPPPGYERQVSIVEQVIRALEKSKSIFRHRYLKNFQRELQFSSGNARFDNLFSSKLSL